VTISLAEEELLVESEASSMNNRVARIVFSNKSVGCCGAEKPLVLRREFQLDVAMSSCCENAYLLKVLEKEEGLFVS
jgi:hypothetical protein